MDQIKTASGPPLPQNALPTALVWLHCHPSSDAFHSSLKRLTNSPEGHRLCGHDLVPSQDCKIVELVHLLNVRPIMAAEGHTACLTLSPSTSFI